MRINFSRGYESIGRRLAARSRRLGRMFAGGSLLNSASRCSRSLLPTSASSSPTKPRSGARWSSSPESSRSNGGNNGRHSINSVPRTADSWGSSCLQWLPATQRPKASPGSDHARSPMSGSGCFELGKLRLQGLDARFSVATHNPMIGTAWACAVLHQDQLRPMSSRH